MMDYYEELGVNRSASTEEIRHAYKRLARILHPDAYSDAGIRRMADLQMKRLNGIVSVLTDPAQRGSYDRSITPSHRADTHSSLWLPKRLGQPLPDISRVRWAVIAATVAAVVLLTAYLARPAQRAAIAAAEIAAPEAAAPQPIRRPGPQGARERAARKAASSRPGAPERAGAISPVAAELPGPVALPPILNETDRWTEPERIQPPVAIQRLRAEPPLAQSVAPASSGELAGNWFYVPAGRSASQGLYPPEYIELRIAESGGVLRGRYRARYRVGDQAISPTVAFQFEGRSPELAQLPWNGAGGAYGQVTLQRLPGGSLGVTWTATRLSEELGLISGSATLIRRQD